MYTYNSFLKELEDNFANLHLQIKRFGAGFIDELGVFATQNEDWPLMYVTTRDVPHLTNSVSSFNMRIYFIDLLENDDDNLQDVMSDQLSVTRDLVNWLRLNDNRFGLLGEPTAYPIKSLFMDYTAGWYMDLSIEVETEGSDCTIPFSGTPSTPPSCDPASIGINGQSDLFTVLSGGTLNIDVEQGGLPVGSLIDDVWVIPVCPLELSIIIAVEDGTDTALFNILTDSEGEILTIDDGGLVNLAIEVNGNPISLPQILETGDVINITYDTAVGDTVIKLEGNQ
jgi:hypothetical protein